MYFKHLGDHPLSANKENVPTMFSTLTLAGAKSVALTLRIALGEKGAKVWHSHKYNKISCTAMQLRGTKHLGGRGYSALRSDLSF